MATRNEAAQKLADIILEIVIEKGAIPAQKQGLKILVTKKAEKTSTRSWVSAI